MSHWTLTSQGFALISLRDMESRKSGARSQNGGGLLLGKRRGERVYLQHEPVSLLPYQQILKRPGWFRKGHRAEGVHGGMLLVSHPTGVCHERLRRASQE